MSASSTIHISTDTVPAPQRLAYWEARNAETLVGLRCATFDGQALQVCKTARALDGLWVTEIRGNAHVIERTEDLVRAHPKDAVFVSLVLESQAFFYYAQGCASVGPGDLIVYPTGAPYLFGFPAPMRQYLFDVPAALLHAAGLAAPARPVRLGADTPAGRVYGAALRRVAAEALRLAPGEVCGEAARHDVLAALEGILNGQAGALASVPAPAHLLAAKAYIRRHLGEPGLGAERVARHCGISTRHLGRLFAAEGTSVASYMLACRLEAARERLAAGAPGGVAQTAFQCGFGSAAHFARVFRARFGMTPTQARGRATSGPA